MMKTIKSIGLHLAGKNKQRDTKQRRARQVQYHNNYLKNHVCCHSRSDSGKAAYHCLCFCLLEKQSPSYINRHVGSRNNQVIVLSILQSLTRIPLPLPGSTNETCGESGEVSVGNHKDDSRVITSDPCGKVKAMKLRWQFLRCFSHRLFQSLSKFCTTA